MDPRWPADLQQMQTEVVNCFRCPRLVQWREEIAQTKRRAYLNWTYWGRPVPSFGDPQARLLIIALAPGAHGANRTGRMFTGDRSGEFLYRALYETGFANQPTSVSSDDGLHLTDCFMTAPVRCVPPDNKPERSEVLNCRPYLHRTLAALKNVKVVVPLGSFGFGEYLSYLHNQSCIQSRSAFPFGHSVLYQTHQGGPLLLGCYHPSQQNTSTRKLTAEMLFQLFDRARQLIEGKTEQD